jgi:N-acetylglutamate synthase-like GNAT family acetyltransferase
MLSYLGVYMQIEIRQAKIKDLERLKVLLEQLGYDKSKEWLNTKLQIYLNSDIYEVLVAEDDGIIVGFITLTLQESFVFDKCMHVETLVIDEKIRGKGIGRELMIAAENFARDNSCDLIGLFTLNKRRKDGTHNFYEKMGYQDQDKRELTYFSKMIK